MNHLRFKGGGLIRGVWTSKNRARYDRSKLRYPSDLTDDAAAPPNVALSCQYENCCRATDFALTDSIESDSSV
jgi:hypothetical protein